MKNKMGFSLLEMVLVLGIGVSIAFVKFQDMKSEQETAMANAVGSQIKQLGEAANRYISVRYDKLSTLSNSAGTGIDPGPRTCSGDSCEITYQTLINEGLLPSTYTGNNVNKSSYKIILKRDGTSPNYTINGLIVTSSAWKNGSKIRYDLLGKAMMAAGIDSGMTKSATVASGYGGQWSEKSSDFNNITAEGLLAYRVGYDSSMYSVYLRRDGTLPMTGNLNMGGQNIYNVKNITASGELSIGGDSSLSGVLSVSGNTTINGVLRVENNIAYLKRLNVNGTSTLTGKVTASGGIETTNLTAKYNVNSDNIRADSNFSAGKTITSEGTIIASGNIKGLTIESTGRITVGEYAQIIGIASLGASCDSNGLQGRTSAGQLLSCISGVWSSTTSLKRMVFIISGETKNYGDICQKYLDNNGYSALGWVASGSDACTEDEEYCTIDNVRCYALKSQ